MYFMVEYVKKNLQSELVSYLYKTENSDKLLNESEHIIERRAETGVMLKVTNFFGSSFKMYVMFIFLGTAKGVTNN